MRRLWIALICLGALLFVLRSWLAENGEGFANRVAPLANPAASPEAMTLHGDSFVVDLHADTTLFGRDLLMRADIGHVDLPRLQEGGVGLQFFTAPTQVPIARNIHRTAADGLDALTLMGFIQWNAFRHEGPLGRALVQAERLRDAADRSGGNLMPIRNRRDLALLRALRTRDPRVVGALLGIEGAHALEGNLENLTPLFDAGYRMIGLTHFFDNAIAGSAHGVERGGLTAMGRKLVAEMERRGVLVDVAHLSPAAIDDVLEIAKKPMVVSHTGVKATCDNPRNLSDEHIRGIAQGGGVIGIGYWEMAVCGIAPSDIVAAMQHVVKLVGDDHVGLGSDYDGGTEVSFDTSQLFVVTQAMLDAGLSQASIRKILGGNVLRVLDETLPGGPRRSARGDSSR